MLVINSRVDASQAAVAVRGTEFVRFSNPDNVFKGIQHRSKGIRLQ